MHSNQSGKVYQHPSPLIRNECRKNVNPTRPPGRWVWYDILFREGEWPKECGFFQVCICSWNTLWNKLIICISAHSGDVRFETEADGQGVLREEFRILDIERWVCQCLHVQRLEPSVFLSSYKTKFLLVFGLTNIGKVRLEPEANHGVTVAVFPQWYRHLIGLSNWSVQQSKRNKSASQIL